MGSSSQTIGYHYSMGIHMGVCRGPVNELVEIKVADRVAWSGSVTQSSTVQINAAELFGGEKGEGGVEGPLDVMMGTAAQPVNAKLAGMSSGLTPAFRGMFTLFFDGLVTSISQYPKPWSVRVRRTTAGWDGGAWHPGACKIEMADGAIHAMNPAHIIYEALTNGDWGMNMPRHLMGTSFERAADQLFAEGFGMCLRWTRQTSINDFIQEIVDHIGANVDLDPRTGLWELSLVRDDYNVNDLPLFDYDNGLLGIDEDDTSAPNVSVNEIIVTYRDPITNEDGQVRVQNLASIQSAGVIRSQTISYTGLPTAELAYRVAQRELKAVSTGVKRFKLRLDRRAYTLLPGSPFRISVPSRGIENLVLRVGSVENGELRQGPIEISAVQDVFGLPSTSFVTAQPPGYVPPTVVPQPIDTWRLMELTYRDTLLLDNIRTPEGNDTAAWVAALAQKSNPLSRNLLIQTQELGGADWTPGDEGDYCPSATIVDAIPLGETPVQVHLADASELDSVRTGTAALIDDEIFRVDSINPEALTATLARGCVDTVPRAHSAGARVWFYGGGYAAVDTTEYDGGETVTARLRSRTSVATLPAEQATGGNLALAGRAGRPYPPARVRINGEAYPSAARGRLNITWATRDKEVIQDQLVDSSMGSVGVPDVVYQARLMRVSDNQIIAHAGDLKEPAVQLFSPSSGAVILQLSSRALQHDPTTQSVQLVEIPLNYTVAGWGNAWGYAWGGTLDSGVIAPRGGLSGRHLQITISGYIDGRYVGHWNDLYVTGEYWIVSSEDAETWRLHSICPTAWSVKLYRINGRWFAVRSHIVYTADSLDGPWTRRELPFNHGRIGTRQSELLNGELLLFGAECLYGTTTGEDWVSYTLPPSIGGGDLELLGIVHGHNGYVLRLLEGNDLIPQSNTFDFRLWRSDDLHNWELVTPEYLAEAKFGVWNNSRVWLGTLHYLAGRYILLTLPGGNSGRHDRMFYYSSDAITWHEATMNGDPGNYYPAHHAAELDGRIYVPAPSVALGYGLPRLFVSNDGGASWDITVFNPPEEYFPRGLFGFIAGPERLFVTDYAPGLNQGTGPWPDGQMVEFLADSLVWKPLRLQRPITEEE